jgi:hypothetical protein
VQGNLDTIKAPASFVHTLLAGSRVGPFFSGIRANPAHMLPAESSHGFLGVVEALEGCRLILAAAASPGHCGSGALAVNAQPVPGGISNGLPRTEFPSQLACSGARAQIEDRGHERAQPPAESQTAGADFL